MKSLALLLAPMLLVAGPAQAALSPQERAMAVSVDADHDASVVLLEKWMNQNSGSMNLEGVRNLDKIRRRATRGDIDEPIGAGKGEIRGLNNPIRSC